MARIAGIDLPRRKRIEIALTYIYGIGLTSAKKILSIAGVNPDIKVNDLTDEDTDKLRKVIEADYKTEGTLKLLVKEDIKRLKEINCYRGIRHKKGLPVRGQRTRT
ncbi:30S ribosomal protein S13, partial [candidate division WOR-3 bacterium]|nr:30S ribosomal protein S13 [candidate division WOR-3 bacterium]